jgi:DNA-binding CsgD family transcriptional regulator
MNLVEREDELAELTGMFEESRRGRGKIALVSGSVTTGKTTLLHAFAERVEAADGLFLGASASLAERGMALGVMSQVFAGVRPSIGESDHLTRLLDEGALGVVLYEADSPGVDDGLVPVAHGLWKALRDLASRRPVVLGIDDVHYADAHSLQCLMYFARRIGSARVMVVLCESTRAHPAHPVIQAELMRHPGHINIRLAPLTATAVATMLSDGLDDETARRLAPEVHRVSGGNPLLVRALLEDQRSHTRKETGELVIGDTFSRSVRSCLYRCDVTVLNIARGLAVLDEPRSASVVGRLFGISANAAQAAMETLEDTGLLDGGAYRHEAARAAVLNGMAPEEYAALHTRAARLLHDDGAPAMAVARHLIAGQPVDAPWVVSVLQDAAEQALFEEELDLAIRFLRMAQQACRDECRQVAITSALANAEWRVDPSAVRRHLPYLTTAVRERRLSTREGNAVVGYLLWHGRLDEALQALEELKPDANTERDIRSLVSCVFPGQIEAGRPPILASVDTAGGNGADPADESVHRAEDDLLRRAEEIFQGAWLEEMTIVSIAAAPAVLSFATWMDKAAAFCELLLKQEPAGHTPLWHGLFRAIRSTLDLRQGKLVTAREHALGAFALLPPKSWGVFLGVPLGSMILASTLMGRYDEAATYLRVVAPEAMMKTPCGLHYIHARGRYHLATGRFHAALNDFLTCGELVDRWNMDTPVRLPWRSDVAQACLGLGRGAEAREMVKEQLARTHPTDTRLRGISLRIMAKTCELRKRPALLREAADALQPSADRFELALTFTDLSRAFQALGQYSQARMLTCRAERLAEQCGAEQLRRSLVPANGSIPDIGGRAIASGRENVKLSDAELRVAALAADGYTNRQISKKLCVTISTVEQHLTRAYRKLDVNRRADLASALQI